MELALPNGVMNIKEGSPLSVVSSAIEQDPAEVKCVHHWDIASPDGEASRGVCRHCNQERFFVNSVERIPGATDILRMPRATKKKVSVEHEEMERTFPQE